jgi:hypothetical protein
MKFSHAGEDEKRRESGAFFVPRATRAGRSLHDGRVFAAGASTSVVRSTSKLTVRIATACVVCSGYPVSVSGYCFEKAEN